MSINWGLPAGLTTSAPVRRSGEAEPKRGRGQCRLGRLGSWQSLTFLCLVSRLRVPVPKARDLLRASSAIVQELPREGNYIRTLPMLQKKKLCESETDEQASAPNKQEK